MQVATLIDSVAKARERFEKVKDALGHGSDPHTGKSWWGRGNTRTGRATGPEAGPHPSRKEAAEAAFSKYPNAHSVSTGYGNFGGHFDIQWHGKKLEKAKDAGGHGSNTRGQDASNESPLDRASRARVMFGASSKEYIRALSAAEAASKKG